MTEEKNWEPEFRERLMKHYDEMKWLYGELYHNDEQAFDYFCSMLHEYYQARSEELKAWDKKREHNADWYAGNGMLGMLM